MFYNNPKPKKPVKGVSFKDCPCLIDKQYQYKTLGEMVAMYKRTGEMPAVGMRNGVYFAKGIDSEFPTTGDVFEDMNRMHGTLDAIGEQEQKLQQVAEHAKVEKDKAVQQELSELRSQLAQAQSKTAGTAVG